jgi:hypothetical protein
LAFDHCLSRTEEDEILAFREDQRSLFHHFFMGDVTIGKDDLMNTIFREESGELLLRVDGNTLRVVRSSKFWGIDSVGDEGDLSGCESDHLIIGSIPEEGVEIMKIPSSSSKNDHPNGFTI